MDKERVSELLAGMKHVRVNVGAGREHLPSMLSFDFPPEANISFDDMEITPDIVGDAMDLPFEDASVDLLRTRDLLLDFEADDPGRIPALGREFRRVLRPGGRLITIETPGFERKFGRLLRIESLRRGSRVPYLERARFYVTTYVKD